MALDSPTPRASRTRRPAGRVRRAAPARLLGLLACAFALLPGPAAAQGGAGDGRGERSGEVRREGDDGARRLPGAPTVGRVPGVSGPEGAETAAGLRAPLPATFTEAPSWVLWWDRHRDDYLRPAPAGPASAGAPGAVGDALSVPPLPESHGRARAELVPTLLAALEGSGLEERLEALLSLGELDPLWTADERPIVRAALLEALASGSAAEAEAARVALAVGAREADLSWLISLLRAESTLDEDRRCALAGLARVANRTEREDVRRLVAHHLLRAREALDRGASELRGAALLALASIPFERIGVRDPGGLPEPPGTSRLSMLRHLLAELEAPGRVEPALEVARVEALRLAVESLPVEARHSAAEGIAEALLERLEARRRPSGPVRQALLGALGALLPSNDSGLDGEVLAALWDASAAADEPTRAAACFALARVAGGSGLGGDETAREVGDELARRLTRGPSTDRPTLALALAAAAHERRRTGRNLPALWRVTLRGALAGASGPEERSALALALGLCGDLESAERVAALLEELPPTGALGRAALGLGLLGPDWAGAPLRAAQERLVADERDAARGVEALALAGDEGLVPRLVNRLASARRDDERRSALLGLARLGDPRPLPEVLGLAADPALGAALHAAALHAAGRMALPDPLAWSRPWSQLGPQAEALLWPGAAVGWAPTARR